MRSQLPIALSDDTEPDPDAAVIDLGSSYFEHPHTARLIIEVADSSLKDDRAKIAVYSSAGIPEYWIVNLGARTVEVYTAPHGARYDELRTLRSGDILRPTNVPDVEIAVSEILPPA